MPDLLLDLNLKIWILIRCRWSMSSRLVGDCNRQFVMHMSNALTFFSRSAMLVCLSCLSVCPSHAVLRQNR